MEDVKVVVASSGQSSSGEGLEPGTRMEAQTPLGAPNLAVHVIGPVVAIAVRNGHLFFITLVALMTTGGMTGQDIVEWGSFAELLQKCAIASSITAAFGIIKDVATLFGKLEQRFPFLTGNV